jgi:hypothetical protein
MRSERGVALIAVLLATTLLLALGGGLMVVATTEARIAGHYRDGLDALYAADGLAQHLLAGLRDVRDVSELLAGTSTLPWVDGAPAGPRTIHGSTIDLNELTQIEQCGRTACSDSALRARTAERPWGPDNPRWRLYAWGWMNAALAAPGGPGVYLVAWIGDDPAENDGDPLRDGTSDGRGRVALRVRAYGAHGTRREVDAIVAGVPERPHLIWWTER